MRARSALTVALWLISGALLASLPSSPARIESAQKQLRFRPLLATPTFFVSIAQALEEQDFGSELRTLLALPIGIWEEVGSIVPLGVPNPKKSAAPYCPDVVRVLAPIFGKVGREIVVEISSASTTGIALPPLPLGFARTKTYVKLTRQSDDPADVGYNRYLSPPIVLMADPRARRNYQLANAEKEQTAAPESREYSCRNCRAAFGYDTELAALAAPPPAANDGESRTTPIQQAFEQWAGEKLIARLAWDAAAETDLKARATYLGSFDLRSVKAEIPVVRADLTPSLRQLPAQNPSLLTTEAGFAVATHSGGAQTAWTDLAIKGRGLDFVLSRYYVSDVLHAGPFGRNMDSPLFARLRDLPTGDVDFYPGDGSRHTFKFVSGVSGQPGRFEAPTGVFLDLFRKPDRTFVLVYPDQTKLFFDETGRLTKLVDRQMSREDGSDGNQMKFFYDGAGRLAAVLDATNRQVRFEYNPDTATVGSRGLIKSVTDFDGRVVSYSYDADGRLMRAEGPDPASGASRRPSTTLSWSPASATDLKQKLYQGGELVSVTDGESREVFRAAYRLAQPASVDNVRLGGGTWRFSYAGAATTVTDPNSNPRVYTHEAAGQVGQVSEPDGAVTRYRYDSEGRLTSLSRPRGGEVAYAYAAAEGNSRLAMGNVTRITESPRPASLEAASGRTRVTAIDYGPANLPTRIVAPGPATTVITRDARGNPRIVALPDSSDRRFDFNERGQLISSRDGRGVTETYTYFDQTSGDKQGYLRTRTVAGVATTSYDVDARGNVTSLRDPENRLATYQINKLDQVEVESRAFSTSRSNYDAAGQLIFRDVLTGTDASSNPIYARTSYAIDELGRLRTRTETGSAGASVSAYGYDDAGNLRTVSRTAAPLVTFDYDNRDRVRSVTTGTSVTRYGYDDDGARTTMISPRNHTTTYLIDGFGRNIGSIDPTSVKTRQVLDPAGRSIETRVTLLSGLKRRRSIAGRLANSTRWGE